MQENFTQGIQLLELLVNLSDNKSPSHFISITTVQTCYSHFRDEEMEAHK